MERSLRQPLSMLLEGKSAVVTGAAGTKGIGRAIALELAREGADVLIADVKQGKEVANEVRSIGRRSIAVVGDLSDRRLAEAMIETCVREFGKIDILVNNVGIALSKDFLDLTEDDWDKVIDVNLKSFFLCSQAAARKMVKRRYGRILNISSISGYQWGALHKQTPYNVSKAGVLLLTRSMALDLAPFNITVNAVAPAYIKTEMSGVLGDRELEVNVAKLIPCSRWGVPEDVAHAVTYLVSDKADFVTGTTLCIDGGSAGDIKHAIGLT